MPPFNLKQSCFRTFASPTRNNASAFTPIAQFFLKLHIVQSNGRVNFAIIKYPRIYLLSAFAVVAVVVFVNYCSLQRNDVETFFTHVSEFLYALQDDAIIRISHKYTLELVGYLVHCLE